MMRRILLLCSILGCSNNFDPASYVTGLRVLGVKAEPPELSPGQTATLTPLVVPSGGPDGGTPVIEWSLCEQPPLPGENVAEDCVAADSGTSLVPLGEGATMNVTMPDLPIEQLGVPDYSGGVYLPVVLKVTQGSEHLTAVYRLRRTLFVSPFLQPNHNPRISDIEIAYPNDAGTKPLGEVELHNGDRIALRAVMTPGSAEQYPQIEGELKLPDGGISLDGGIRFFDGGVEVGGNTIDFVTENMKVSWFTTIGTVSPEVTGEEGKLDTTLELKKRTPPPPAEIDLYVVVRDDRGGTDFTHRVLHLR
jgi:hypothetical protein